MQVHRVHNSVRNVKQTFVTYFGVQQNAASGKTEENRAKPIEGSQNPHNFQINKTNAQITKDLKITQILDKLMEYKRNWI